MTTITAAAAADTTITTTIWHLVPFFCKLLLPYILNWRLCFSNTLEKCKTNKKYLLTTSDWSPTILKEIMTHLYKLYKLFLISFKILLYQIENKGSKQI